MDQETNSEENFDDLAAAKTRNWLKIFTISASVIIVAAVATMAVMYRPETKVAQKKDIPVLKYGLTQGPLNTFWPQIDFGIDELHLNSQIFEGLVTYENKKIVPMLATKWSNPDDSTWVFDLKAGVKFHTGKTLTGQDVKASLEQLKESEFGSTYVETIKDIEVVTPTQVKITTDGPDAILLNRLAFAWITDSTAKQKNDPANGTGPYVVKPGTKPTATSVNLVAYDQYHGGHVYTRELQVSMYEDQKKMAQDLREGKLNLAYFDGPEGSKLASEGKPNIKLDDPVVYAININHNFKGVLQNKKVREAIWYTLDPAAFLKSRDIEGKPADQLVIQDVPGYNPAIKRPKRDIAKAKQLMAEAGYANGATISFYHGPPSAAAAQEIADQLKEIGITLKLTPFTSGEAAGQLISQGKVESFYRASGSDILDLSDVVGANFQTPLYSNDEVDKLIEQANRTFDARERLDLLQETSQVIMDDLAWIPLYSGKNTFVLDQEYQIPVDMPAVSYLGSFFRKVHTK